MHFNDKGAYGRVIFLQPVDWKTEWPFMGNDKDGDGCGASTLAIMFSILPLSLTISIFSTFFLGLAKPSEALPKRKQAAKNI